MLLTSVAKFGCVASFYSDEYVYLLKQKILAYMIFLTSFKVSAGKYMTTGIAVVLSNISSN